MVEEACNNERRLPPGSYPVMLTAFHSDGSIDWDGVDRLTDFYIETGAAGLFAGGLSAEVDQMSDAEKSALAARVVKRSAGRVPVIAGALSQGGLDQQADLVSSVHDCGATAVTISACQIAEVADDDSVWIQRAESLLSRISGSVQLALYECPWPYHRLMTDRAIQWAGETGRFRFLKDTCCDTQTLIRRIAIVRSTPMQLFNANNERLLVSLQAGADGFCGVGANYFPELFAWLCENHTEEPDLATQLQQFLFSCNDIIEGPSYPVSAKEYLRGRGLEISTFSRRVSSDPPVATSQGLEQTRPAENMWRQRLAV